MERTQKMASVLIPQFTALQMQYKLKSSFSKNNYCRTLPGTIPCGSKAVIQITEKRSLFRKAASYPQNLPQAQQQHYYISMSRQSYSTAPGHGCHLHSASICSSNTVTLRAQTGRLTVHPRLK